MRTRKMRLMSFVLALAMMLAIAPASAFADSESSGTAEINVPLTENGLLDTTADGVEQDGTNKYKGDGWTYDATKTTPELTIMENRVADFSNSDIALKCKVINKGTIKGGTFASSVQNKDPDGVIENGNFKGYVSNWGTIKGGYFASVENATNITGGVFYGTANIITGNVTGGVFKTPVKKSGSELSNQYKIEALDCKINDMLEDAAYVMVNGATTKVKIEFNAGGGFNGWESEDITIPADVDSTLEFDMPAKNVTLTALHGSSELTFTDGIPDGIGSKSDKWTYRDGKLTFYAGYEVDLGETEVNCPVDNEGTIVSGVFTQTVTNKSGAKISGGTFVNTVTNKGTIEGGVFAKVPAVDTYYVLNAANCVINNAIKNKAYVVAKNANKLPQITVESNAGQKFKNWKSAEMEIPAEKLTVNPLVFTAPQAVANNELNITAVKVKTDIVVGPNGKPVDGNEEYSGSKFDGWEYANNTLTVYSGYTADLDGHTVDWKVNNYGVVKNGTFIGAFANKTDSNNCEGTVESGVFTREADFGTQKPSITWVTLKNATLNEGISDMALVVGKQTVTVAADDADGFTGWSVSGNTDFELTEEQKKSPVLSNLEIDGSDGGTIVLTAMRDTSKYRIKMLDGKANVTSALPGETVTLSIDDSEIPEGMSFDHWVISPDVELEGGFKATDRTTSFTMPAQELTIYASLRTDSDDGTDAMTIVAGVAIGAGAAVLTYHIGTELYAKQVLGDGVAVPKTREEVALKAWELAGKPAVAIDGEPLSETAQAEKWAVESGLMQSDANGEFNGAKKMNKLKALRTLDAAKKLG